MRVVDRFPREVVEEARLRIPMSDGLHLAGRLWRRRYRGARVRFSLSAAR